ncbi:MAG: YceI family protein [Acidithiobacillus sp.]|nr:YceI family protein [Acidithiobacillus sp.]
MSAFHHSAILGLGLLLIVPVANAAAGYHTLQDNPNGTYRIDPDHSQVFFTIGHVGIGLFTGRFDKISGTYTFNAQNPAKDSVKVTIPAASINTDLPLRDQHLRSAEFFDVQKYPDITFVSTKYQPTSKDQGLLYGNLTLHGVTHPVIFHVKEIGAGPVQFLPKPWGGYLSGFVATTSIKRGDYGMTAYLPAGLSNQVNIKVEVEGVRTQK